MTALVKVAVTVTVTVTVTMTVTVILVDKLFLMLNVCFATVSTHAHVAAAAIMRYRVYEEKGWGGWGVVAICVHRATDDSWLQEGCSVRLLNPQTFDNNVWALCASLQEYFGCMVGCNT